MDVIVEVICNLTESATARARLTARKSLLVFSYSLKREDVWYTTKWSMLTCSIKKAEIYKLYRFVAKSTRIRLGLKFVNLNEDSI